MKYTIAISALIILAMIGLVVAPVSSANVYVDNNPAIHEVLPMDSYGYVIFYIRAGGSAQDLTIWIKNNEMKNATFDPTYHPDRSDIVDQNPEFMKVTVLSDGVSKPFMLSSGTYTAYLQKGNGDQMETREFMIGGGATTQVPFLGDAVSTHGERECVPSYKILKASYGNGVCWYVTVIDKEAWDETVIDKGAWTETIQHPAETHVVHHEAITHQVTIVDHPAWDETVVDHPAWDEKVIDVPAHTEYRTVTTTCFHVTDTKVFNENHHPVTKVKCTNHAEHGDGWHVQTADCTKCTTTYGTWQDTNPCGGFREQCGQCDYETRNVAEVSHIVHHNAVTHIVHHNAVTHQVTIVDHPAWDETVVDKQPWTETIQHPAETHIVHHEAVTHQEQKCNDIVDITSAVQSIVTGGHYKFMFDTDRKDGGIFSDLGQLLYGMTSPSETGYQNMATVKYNTGCGDERTLTGTDYCMFNLQDGTVSCNSPSII